MLALFLIHWDMSDIIALAIIAIVLLLICVVTVFQIAKELLSSAWKKLKKFFGAPQASGR